ncbi:MAG: hypothetical protein L0241_30490 [Planctomycetia bacterium]|nr:hypothetical protein [Planctomycetia bacterium]
MTRKRKWTLRLVAVGMLAIGAICAWAAVNAPALRARYAAQKLTASTTDEERAKWADALVGYGEPGFRKLLECVKFANDPTRAAAVAALDRHLTALPEGDPRAITVAGLVLEAFDTAGEPGQRAIVGLLPTILKRTGSTHAARCREIVAVALQMPGADSRLAAVRLTLHPDINMRAELRPLLAAAEPEVRAAALFAAASLGEGDSLLGDEDLFKWLHDPDAGVRKICHDALVGRERSDAEIRLGWRLVHPDPVERLKLLIDLRYDDDVADPEPWLERLSRDPEPAVRAGSARVAVELAIARKLSSPAWVARIADADPHPAVRLVASYYRAQPTPHRHPIRPIGGQ